MNPFIQKSAVNISIFAALAGLDMATVEVAEFLASTGSIGFGMLSWILYSTVVATALIAVGIPFSRVIQKITRARRRDR